MTGVQTCALPISFKAENETTDLWQHKWNENQTVLAAAIHTPDRDTDSPGRCSSWELEFRDCGAITGQGLLLTAERLSEGM